MEFLRPENLLRFGYKDCVLCEVERKGEEKRCDRCSGRLDTRDRLLWEINRERIRRTAGRLSLVYPGVGHFYSGRIAYGIFWASFIPLCVGLALALWKGMSFGHVLLLFMGGMTWWLAWLDAKRGPREPVAPCEIACPSRIQVPDYIALVRENRPLEALALVHDRLPLAAFCGRACPHPCEQECVRSEFGAPISIMGIKRYAADLGYAAGCTLPSGAGEGLPAPRVAVIGGGPAGLSAADTLARLGARVTVFDSRVDPGGMMRYGAGEFRFPMGALLSDVNRILDRGVRFHGGVTFGKDVTFSTLEQEGFEAVLVAVGTREALNLPGAGSEEQGFYDALSFLERVREKRPPDLQGRVVVVGGGDVAIDVARSALRLGAPEVTIACIEPREAMPASPWEVEGAVSEGARLVPNAAVKRFLLREGRVTGFEAVRVERVDYDPRGRIVPRTVSGSEFHVPAETVVAAIGSRADMGFLPPDAERAPVDEKQHVFRLIFREGEFRIPAYVCGDCVRGPGTVVEASASGRAAALNIYSRLCVEEVRKARYLDNYRRRFEPQVPDRPEWRVRLRAERLPPAESRGSFEEVEKGFTAECAVREAERCARCNLCL